jgi:hypothetical protein
VHAKDGMHTRTGRAIEENHRKWFSSQALTRLYFVPHRDKSAAA